MFPRHDSPARPAAKASTPWHQAMVCPADANAISLLDGLGSPRGTDAGVEGTVLR